MLDFTDFNTACMSSTYLVTAGAKDREETTAAMGVRGCRPWFKKKGEWSVEACLELL